MLYKTKVILDRLAELKPEWKDTNTSYRKKKGGKPRTYPSATRLAFITKIFSDMSEKYKFDELIYSYETTNDRGYLRQINNHIGSFDKIYAVLSNREKLYDFVIEVRLKVDLAKHFINTVKN